MMMASKQPPIAKANISKVKFAECVGLPPTPTTLKKPKKPKNSRITVRFS